MFFWGDRLVVLYVWQICSVDLGFWLDFLFGLLTVCLVCR